MSNKPSFDIFSLIVVDSIPAKLRFSSNAYDTLSETSQQNSDTALGISPVPGRKRRRHCCNAYLSPPQSNMLPTLKDLTSNEPLEKDVKSATISQKEKNPRRKLTELKLIFRFPKKRKAKDYASIIGTGVPVISQQLKVEGTRRYGVCAWDTFFHGIYRHLLPVQRVFYEIILANNPRKLFMDIDAELNSSSLSLSKQELEEKTRLFIVRTQSLIQQLYEIQVLNCIVLDASKETKFSKHLIFNLEYNAMFYDDTHLRTFVYFLQLLCFKENLDYGFLHPKCTTGLSEEKEGNHKNKNRQASKATKANTIDGSGDGDDNGKNNSNTCPAEESFLIDLAVYKGDREFRLYGSTKLTQNRPFTLDTNLTMGLQLDNSGVYLDQNFDQTDLNYELFIHSLVAHVPKNEQICRILECKWNELAIKRLPSKLYRTFLPLISSSKLQRQNFASKSQYIPDIQFKHRTRDTDPEINVLAKSDPYTYFEQKDANLFDRIACSMELKTGLNTTADYISYFQYYPETMCISFASSSKYCEIVRREHAHNHVFFVAWLESKMFYMRCLDLQCKVVVAKRAQKLAEKQRQKNQQTQKFQHNILNDGTKQNEQSHETQESKQDNVELGIDDNSPVFLDNTDYARGIIRILHEELWSEINEFVDKEKSRLNAFHENESNGGEINGERVNEDIRLLITKKKSKQSEPLPHISSSPPSSPPLPSSANTSFSTSSNESAHAFISPPDLMEIDEMIDAIFL